MPELTPKETAVIKAATAALYDFRWRQMKAGASDAQLKRTYDVAYALFVVVQNHSR